MKNRDQVRAKNALDACRQYRGVQGGDALSGFPALIVGNGLLATIAFCKKQQGDYTKICDAVARHLSDPDIALLEPGCDNTDAMLKTLANSDSQKLRLCTAEALAYLNFLRRFGKVSPDAAQDDTSA
ncbi:MAG TPA: type III-B CRISPR module-associated protein Cmr5 [Acidobacteriota bacterium]|nr:type III-B CRISPR module-associated protein Cmr5 [Acidobacteriota bacterium]